MDWHRRLCLGGYGYLRAGSTGYGRRHSSVVPSPQLLDAARHDIRAQSICPKQVLCRRGSKMVKLLYQTHKKTLETKAWSNSTRILRSNMALPWIKLEGDSNRLVTRSPNRGPPTVFLIRRTNRQVGKASKITTEIFVSSKKQYYQLIRISDLSEKL